MVLSTDYKTRLETFPIQSMMFPEKIILKDAKHQPIKQSGPLWRLFIAYLNLSGFFFHFYITSIHTVCENMYSTQWLIQNVPDPLNTNIWDVLYQTDKWTGIENSGVGIRHIWREGSKYTRNLLDEFQLSTEEDQLCWIIQSDVSIDATRFPETRPIKMKKKKRK